MKTLKEMKEYLDIQIVEIQNTDKELTEYEFNKLKKLTYARTILEELSREDVSEIYYSSYEASTCEEYRKHNLNEYLDNQAWVVDNLFPIYTDDGNLDINVEFLDDSLEFTMIEEV